MTRLYGWYCYMENGVIRCHRTPPRIPRGDLTTKQVNRTMDEIVWWLEDTMEDNQVDVVNLFLRDFPVDETVTLELLLTPLVYTYEYAHQLDAWLPLRDRVHAEVTRRMPDRAAELMKGLMQLPSNG